MFFFAADKIINLNHVSWVEQLGSDYAIIHMAGLGLDNCPILTDAKAIRSLKLAILITQNGLTHKEAEEFLPPS